MAVPSADSHPPRGGVHRLTLALGLAAAVAAVAIPLAPPEIRPWNFALFGAIGVFVAARGGRRVGLPAAVVIALSAKLVFDLLNYVQHNSDSDYLPIGAVYLSLLAYPVAGWLIAGPTGGPARIGLAAFAGSVGFFLATNAASWLRAELPYSPGLAGLLESYAMGLPFWRGTLAGDLGFTAALFTLNAVLTRATAADDDHPRGTLIPIEVEQRTADRR